jgi:hypothetical protein
LPTAKTAATSANETVQVYPNPSNGIFTLQAETAERNVSMAQVKMIDMFGKTVAQYNVPVTNGSIRKQMNTTQLPNGLYTMVYTIGNTTKTVKMVIQK